MSDLADRPNAPAIQETCDLSAFVRRMVFDAIWAERDDPSEMKERIMLARGAGFLSDEETEEWIVLAGLEAA